MLMCIVLNAQAEEMANRAEEINTSNKVDSLVWKVTLTDTG